MQYAKSMSDLVDHEALEVVGAENGVSRINVGFANICQHSLRACRLVSHIRVKAQLKKPHVETLIFREYNSFVPRLLMQYAKSVHDLVDHRALRVAGSETDVSKINAGFVNIG